MMNKKLIIAGAFAAFAISALSAAPKYISPNNDGVKDELVIPLNISDKRYIQGWSLVIMDSNHQVVRTIENKVALPEKVGFKSFFKQLVTPKQGVVVPESVSWNGAMSNGETAPDGTYYYYLTATDDNGNKGQTKEYEVIVDTISPDIELAQPGDKIFGEGAKSAFKVRQTGSKEDEWVGTFKSADGTVVKTEKWTNAEPAEFNWYGTNDEGAQVPDGVYSYEITATDRAGNVAPKSVISNIIYSADKPATNIFVDGSRYFSPRTESNLQTITFNLTIPTPEEKTGNKLVEWAVNIKDEKGNVVRSYNQEKNGAVPPASIVFDGTGDDGKLLGNAQYRAVVTAKYLNGYEPAEISSAAVVLDTEKPAATITASEKTFGAGAKTSVTFSIAIAPSSGAPVYTWRGEIRNVDTGAVVSEYSFNEYPPQTIVWNGIASNGGIAENGNYVFVLSGTDLAGNVGGGTSGQAVAFSTDETQLLLAMTDSAFSPNGNKVKDTITFNPVTATKDIVKYEFAIKDAKGKVVYSQNTDSALPANFVWDGKDNDKILCTDGSYVAHLSVTAANGSTAEADTQAFELDTVAPSLTAEAAWAAFSPNGNGAQKNLPVTIKDSTSEKLWNAEVRDAKGKAIYKFSWNDKKDSITWNGTDESGNMAPDGTYNLVLFATDDAGNSFSSEIKGITLDNRETKGYVTADLEGISSNGDGVLDTQKFEIRTSVSDNIVSWNFDVRKEDGTSVYALSEKDSADLPAVINWNGAGADGIACEGTFMGTLEITYKNGNKVSAVSSPFVCTATAPQLKVQTAPQYFSPDNDGTDDDLFIKLTGSTKASIKKWAFTIKDPRGRDFWRTNGKAQITERIVWDGLSNVQKDANGNAERVQSAMDYPYIFTVTDTLGMTSTVEGVIPVDVLVIRDGNVLKMAVPSIIFESDSANFQTANSKLDKAKVDNNIKILNRIADILKKFKDYKVTVVGHANKLTNNPDEETVDNPREWGRASMPLSKERADAIKVYLTKRGVNANALSTDGLGGTKPVVDPKDKDNNWKNRRVEFILEK
ncbi:MAG: OmpA family protein [Treponema sp.]|nr:OmpA family protein [Treponema sp.]